MWQWLEDIFFKSSSVACFQMRREKLNELKDCLSIDLSVGNR